MSDPTPYLVAVLVAVLSYAISSLDRLRLAAQTKKDKEDLAAAVIGKADTLVVAAFREQQELTARDSRTRKLIEEFAARTDRSQAVIHDLVNSKATEANALILEQNARIAALEKRLGELTGGREGTQP